MSEPVTPVTARAALGVASRRRDPEAMAAARQDLVAANLAAYIERTVAAAPPLPADKRAYLAGLLGVVA